ncbi:hypothetical protein, partial [Accumulibacter sp.]|uniref:hypothetical protein n=1 Tax=Accumulibacter sp. TaxID=2053492 RepID=UPI0025830671
AARGDFTIPSSCQAFFHFLGNFFGAGMSSASAGDRECLNFSLTYKVFSSHHMQVSQVPYSRQD